MTARTETVARGGGDLLDAICVPREGAAGAEAIELRFRRLVDSLPAAIYTTDATGAVTYYNRAAAALWGRDPEIGKEMWCGSWKIYRPDGAPMPLDKCPMAVALRERRPVVGEEIIVERPDGLRRRVMPHPRPILDSHGLLLGAVNMLVDVTDNRSGDEARALLAAIVTSSDDAIISKTLDGIITSWNEGAERIFGYTREEAIGRSVRMLIPPDRQGEEEEVLARIPRAERVDHYQTVRLTKDGREVDISLTVSPVRDHAGKIIGASKVARDITELKRIELALAERERRLRAIFGQAAVGIVLGDLEGRLLEANDRMCQILGRTREELLRSSARELTHPEDWVRNEGLMNETVGGKRPGFSIEKRYLRGDGSWVWANVSVTSMADEQGRPTRLVGVVEDISERLQFRHELERQVGERTAELEQAHSRLREGERLTALGGLAAGLGHDLANLILPLRTRLDSVDPGPPDGMLAADLTAIRRGLDYLQRLASGLRLMAVDRHVSSPLPAATTIPAWWEEVEGIFKAALPRGMRLESSIPADFPPVAVGQAGLTQAVFNLVQNAAEALGARPDGLVRVEAERSPAAGPDQPARALLRVIDNGPGMSPETLSRCFEPYFSTKQRSISTGMGLALVRSVALSAGGTVTCESREGQGARFTLALPIAEVGAKSPGAPVHATITLTSARDAALAAAVLDALGVRVLRNADAGDVDLWIGDAPPPQGAAAFLSAGDARCVVLLTRDAKPADDRIIHCAPAPDTRTMRAAFERALRGLRPAAAPSHGAPA